MVNITALAANTLILGALYSLIAIGFTIIFGVGGVLNLAHGASITIAGYTVYYITEFAPQTFDAAIWVAAVAALVVPAVFSYVLYKGMVRYAHNPIQVLILTLLVALIVEQVFIALEGVTPQVVPELLNGEVALGSTSVQLNAVAAFVASWIVVIALFVFIERTKTGKALVATSQNKKGAALVGIDAERMFTYTWVIAGLLAGVAGLFLATSQTVYPFLGRQPLLLAFAIVVLGGLGSIKGSVVGAYIIAFLDQLTVSLIDPALTGLSALVVLVVVLLVKPEGLFGRELVEES